MTVGIPKAFLFYRYEYLWRTFFSRLGCETVVSGDTTQAILQRGVQDAISECCLPAKIYLGHVHALLGRCDALLVPRIVKLGRDEEMCVRLLGLFDVVRHTYGIEPLHYNIHGARGEHAAFLRMGAALGKSVLASHQAYAEGVKAQIRADDELKRAQQALLKNPRIKILLAAPRYLLREALLGEPVVKLITAMGGVALMSDGFDSALCVRAAREVAPSLYWLFNREAVGAAWLCRAQVDGIILLTAFPCGSDAMANEMLCRKLDIPAIQIVLDENTSDTGIITRIESFWDILLERRRKYA